MIYEVEARREDKVIQTEHENSEVHVYAGTAGHSAWFSDDNGETWIHPNSHSGMYLEQRVWSLASHPRTPHRLFAGTDGGVFRWDEATARWVHLPSPMNDVWSIAVDPTDPDVLGCHAARRDPAVRRQRRADACHAGAVRSG
jgi:hypothetical protein